MAGHIQLLLKSSRLPFLLLTLVAISLAASSIAFSDRVLGVYPSQPDFSRLPWVYAGALFAHLSVNLFNEFWDFKSGLDLNTQRTPFSGGSGALPAQPQGLRSVLLSAILFFLLTVFTGVFLLVETLNTSSGLNLELLFVGLAGLLLVLLYTGPVQRYPFLCWAAPGLGFGILMFTGTETVLTNSFSLVNIPAALLVLILSSNLLLLNQLPDMDADAQIGRRHLWIIHGEQVSLRVYLLSTCLIPLIVLVGIDAFHWPLSSLLAFLPWSLTLLAWQGAKRYRKQIAAHHAYLAMNVIASLLVPLFLSVAFLLA
jgi:1,4-dihydroxy-2-naphthoate octaprenyltransferase